MNQILLSDIQFNEENYPRLDLNDEVVEDYKEAMKGGAQFPPIIVFKDKTGIYLADGLHRLNACRRLKRKRISADVRKGTERDAVLYSLGANSKHGVRRTREDKRKSVLILLQDEEWRTWSTNVIAQRCNVAWGTVESVWKEHAKALHLPKFEDRSVEVERKGKVYTQAAKKKSDSPTDNPVSQSISEMMTAAEDLQTHFAREHAPDLQKKADKISSDLHQLLGKATGASARMASLEYPVNLYTRERKDGVKKNPKFEEKGLCTHSVGVGFSCGHQCSYCSTPAMVRQQGVFKSVQQTSFCRGHAIIDPNSAKRIRNNIPKGLTEKDVIQFSTIDDGWSPEARRYDLGQSVMEALLEDTDAQIRVLTKSAEVAKDFGLFKRYSSRVIVGLSISIPPNREDYARAVEPNASPIKERIAALKKAHKRGLRTYGMICPCLPMVADTKEALGKLFDTVIECGAEDIWLEPVNARGKALTNTVSALVRAGLNDEAAAVDAIRNEAAWSQYTHDLIKNAIATAKKRGVLDKLKILLYPTNLTEKHKQSLEKCRKGIVWL